MNKNKGPTKPLLFPYCNDPPEVINYDDGYATIHFPPKGSDNSSYAEVVHSEASERKKLPSKIIKNSEKHIEEKKAPQFYKRRDEIKNIFLPKKIDKYERRYGFIIPVTETTMHKLIKSISGKSYLDFTLVAERVGKYSNLRENIQ